MALQARRLENDELTKLFPRRGEERLAEYEELLRGMEPGDGCEVTLNGESVRAHKRRLGQAVKRVAGQDATLSYSKVAQGESTLVFQMRTRRTPRRSRQRGRAQVDATA